MTRVVGSDRLIGLLSSDLPGDQATLDRTLAQLPPATAVPILYAITRKSRPLSPRFLVPLVVRAIVAVLFLFWISRGLQSPFSFGLFVALVLPFALKPITNHLRFRKARKAVFYLARFNDARAIGELLRYRRFRARQPEQEAVTERVEAEITRLLDELTGFAFIPGEDRLRSVFEREYFTRWNRQEWSSTRVYFYIAILRFLSTQNLRKHRDLIETVASRSARTEQSVMIREAAQVLLGQVPTLPVATASLSAPLLATVSQAQR